MKNVCILALFQGLLILNGISSAYIGSDEYKTYENYKVYRVLPRTDGDICFLADLENDLNMDGIDFWKLDKIIGHSAEVMVPPNIQEAFEDSLTINYIPFEIIIHDLQQVFDEEKLENNAFKFRRTVPKKSFSLDISRYYTYDEIIDYLTQLSKQFPKTVKLSSAGKSYLGRDIPILEISNGDGNKYKNTVFVDAGVHCREWIAPAEGLYIINQLVENTAENADLLKDLNWVVIPLINVDGYIQTHTKNRMWRKTMKPNRGGCVGTDGNRNYGYEWGGAGASTNPCSDTYRGETAFSEPETQAVRNALMDYRNVTKFYLTLHSYGNYLLYPWGFTSSLPPNWKELDNIGKAGANAISAATGTRYTVGSSTNVLYVAAGGSDDYALGELKIPYSLTMELPRGGTGFDPPPSQIERLVKETWIGIRAMAKYLISKNLK